jgi:hypothetical protein
MKFAKRILFMFALVAAFSMASFAQKGGDGQKPPPKGNPPVINPAPQKPPRDNPPKGGEKPKKPGMDAAIWREDIGADIA